MVRKFFKNTNKMALVSKTIVIGNVGKFCEFLRSQLRKGKLELADPPVLGGAYSDILPEQPLKGSLVNIQFLH